jgi:hypothetical protein
MSSKIYIGCVTENYNEVENFYTKAYTKSLQNLKECLYEALQICVKQNYIDYENYVENNDLNFDTFSGNNFIEKLKSELSEIPDEKLCIQEFENICYTYGNSYYNQKWWFSIVECNLVY